MEFLEALPGTEEHKRWLVREHPDAEPRVLWLILDDHREWLAKTESDARSWLGLAHPRISRIHAVTRFDDARVGFTIDDDRGPSFAAAGAMLADAPVDRERWAVAQLITIADGLATMRAHRTNFVHRRIEPHQLFVDPTGRVRLRAPVGLVPWGEGRNYVGAGRVTGSPRFMSPEQVRATPLSPATDVFALAGNLAMVLTGAPPFGDGDEMMPTLMAILNQPPHPIRTYAPGLDAVLERAFAKHAHERYPDPAAFAAALYDCVPDAGDYDAVFSDRIAAWWPSAPPAFEASTDFDTPSCKQSWDSLPGTGDIRQCGACKQPVVRVTSLRAALPLIGHHCIAYQR